MNRRFFRNTSLLVAALILLGSLGPYDFRHWSLMSQANSINILGLFSLTPHRLVHLFAFTLLSLCLTLAGRREYHRILALSAVIGFGVLVETLEFLTTANPFEYWDVRDDAFAACLGYALVEAYLISRRFLPSASRAS